MHRRASQTCVGCRSGRPEGQWGCSDRMHRFVLNPRTTGGTDQQDFELIVDALKAVLEEVVKDHAEKRNGNAQTCCVKGRTDTG